LLQFNLGYNMDNYKFLFDWSKISDDLVKFGIYNSFLTALMPTASTSQILGNIECFEPLTSNMFIRKTSSGVFKCINYNLIDDLTALGLWNEEMKNKIIANNGSIQNISSIPDSIKQLYKTVWEIKQKAIMDHAIARAPFTDQSQSMNLHFTSIDLKKIANAMRYAWKNQLKTGSYYVRSQSAQNASNLANCNIDKSSCDTCSA